MGKPRTGLIQLGLVVIGVLAVVVALAAVDWRLGVGVAGVLLILAGLFISYEE